MFDHILRFESEAEAETALSAYRVESEEGETWRGDVCIPGAQVYRIVDGEREYYSGWYIVIMERSLSAALRDLPGNACRLITDRDAAERGDPFILYAALDVTQEMLGQARIEPVPLGSGYPFGSAG